LFQNRPLLAAKITPKKEATKPFLPILAKVSEIDGTAGTINLIFFITPFVSITCKLSTGPCPQVKSIVGDTGQPGHSMTYKRLLITKLLFSEFLVI
jgi:hypothetical protein